MTENSTHAASTADLYRHYVTGISVATLGGVFLAVTGALGTDAAGFGKRLAFWLVVMLAGAMIGIGISITVKAWGKLAGRVWAEVLVISVLLALPQTLIVVAARSLFFDLRVPVNSGIAILFGFVLFISVAMVALDHAIHKHGRAQPIAPLIPATGLVENLASPEQRFRERLPKGLREARLLALEAEDHYLRVHTDRGSALILMRLIDAVTELASYDGGQTHRSWWVARAAIASSQRGESRAILTLTEGQKVPVSRSFYHAINEAGWLS